MPASVYVTEYLPLAVIIFEKIDKIAMYNFVNKRYYSTVAAGGRVVLTVVFTTAMQEADYVTSASKATPNSIMPSF